MRYSESSAIAKTLRRIFFSTWNYVSKIKNLPENINRKFTIQIPQEHQEFLVLSATDLPNVFVADCITTSIKAEVKKEISMQSELEYETFDKNVWEPACGEGNLSEVLKKHGHNVYSTDLIDRGYANDHYDFLKTENKWFGDIITNPPFKLATEFVKKSLESIDDGKKVAMFLKLNYILSWYLKNL